MPGIARLDTPRPVTATAVGTRHENRADAFRRVPREDPSGSGGLVVGVGVYCHERQGPVGHETVLLQRYVLVQAARRAYRDSGARILVGRTTLWSPCPPRGAGASVDATAPPGPAVPGTAAWLTRRVPRERDTDATRTSSATSDPTSVRHRRCEEPHPAGPIVLARGRRDSTPAEGVVGHRGGIGGQVDQAAQPPHQHVTDRVGGAWLPPFGSLRRIVAGALRVGEGGCESLPAWLGQAPDLAGDRFRHVAGSVARELAEFRHLVAGQGDGDAVVKDVRQACWSMRRGREALTPGAGARRYPASSPGPAESLRAWLRWAGRGSRREALSSRAVVGDGRAGKVCACEWYFLNSSSPRRRRAPGASSGCSRPR
ncbi:hypothetical protein SHIRM173S_01791 [Streptomyces hirsutus]